MDTRLLTAAEITQRMPQLIATYEAMYRMEPGEGQGYAVELLRQSNLEAFRLAAAIEPETDAVIGFGMGFTGRPGQPWRDSLATVLDAALVDRWLDGHFEFSQFGVAPAFQRKGIGTVVYDTLFADLHNQLGVLTVIEHNEPALAFYQRRGRQVLHEHFYSTGGHGPYLVMGRELRG